MPEITGWCNTSIIRTYSPVGALPQSIYPARDVRRDAAYAFNGGGYSLDRVRFMGYWEYGTGAENVPPLLLSVNLFYRAGMTDSLLNEWAQKLAVKAGDKFDGLNVIAKLYAGNNHGFGEVNKPQF